MSTPTPSIPGVDRDALADAILRGTLLGPAASSRAADNALAHIAARHECALPATWDDGGARPVEGKHGWVTPLLPGGSQRFPDGTPVEAWDPDDDEHRFLRHIAGCRYSIAIGPGSGRFPWPEGALIRHVLPPTACDREHADEWAEVRVDGMIGLPMNVRVRQEWEKGFFGGSRLFVHRDDLPDADLVERMAKAIWDAGESPVEWESQSEIFREDYRAQARAALAALREEEQ